MSLRVCVCGGRYYTHKDRVWTLLDIIRQTDKDIIIICGGAKGADSLAWDWALDRGVRHEIYVAEWKKHGRSAGPIRNQKMLDLGIDLLIAMPGGVGTEHMVKICKKKDVRVYEDKWLPHVIMSAPEGTDITVRSTMTEKNIYAKE